MSERISGDKNYFFKHGQGKLDSYGMGWQAARRRARRRDQHTCRGCGKTADELGHEPQVHHIVPYRLSHDNGLRNLICLCKQCHRKAEAQAVAELLPTGQLGLALPAA